MKYLRGGLRDLIVIKSFTKLPDNCADCSLNYDFCSCSADYNISFDINDDLGSGRRENCPLVEVEAQPEPLSDAYMKAVWTWLLNYQIKAAELKGRYTPYEVLSWVANDWRKEHE